jgi:hypothetical protein
MHQPVELPDDPTIKFVRLSTGEDLISEVVEVKDDKEEYYLLVNPLKIVYVTGEKKGSIMLSFIEWVFPKITEKQQFKIYPSDVITMAEASTKIEDYYFEALIKLEKYVHNTEDDGIDFDTQTEKEPEPTEEEIEYIKTLLEDMSNNTKRKPH